MRSTPRSAPLEYVVQQHSSGWQVLLGGQLLGDHATYLHAYRAAEAQATLAVGRGQPSKIVPTEISERYYAARHRHD